MCCVQEGASQWPPPSLLAAAKSDGKAMNEVVGILFRVIAKWASRFHVPRTVDKDDLISLGLEVAVEVIRQHQPSSGVPFGRYLRLCIDRKWRRERPKLSRREVRCDTDGIADLRDRLAQEATSAQVREILGKMEKSGANLIRAAYGIGVERMAVDEIARREGVASGTQHSRLKAAIAEFRELWE